MVGLAAAFRGQPSDPDWRYADQIMGHLIDQAAQLAAGWPDDQKWLVLVVDPQNLRAIQFYQRCGFELIPNAGRKDGQHVMKVWLGE
jgi:ribosomal protein S18 acetylase RimI-like enzyme